MLPLCSQPWPQPRLCLPFILLMRSKGSSISQHVKGSNYTKVQQGLSILTPQTISTAKPRGSMGSSKKWKAELHTSDGVMRSSRSQMISRILWEEPGISSHTMGNFRLITYMSGKPPIYTEFQERHKTRPTYTAAL